MISDGGEYDTVVKGKAAAGAGYRKCSPSIGEELHIFTV